jgi:DNA-binding HxlR family transcriptional regulator
MHVQKPAEPSSSRSAVSPLAAGLEIFGDPWSFLLAQEAFFDVRRFNDFGCNLPIARNTLTDRLRQLVEQDIFTRIAYQHNPVRYEYRLTERGLGSYPYAIMLMFWGDAWLEKDSAPRVVLTHTRCGAKINPVCRCQACKREVTPDNVLIDAGIAPTVSRSRNLKVRYSSRPALYCVGRVTSTARTLSLIGDRWSFSILWLAVAGVTRASEFHRTLGVARPILSNRIKRLIASGILRRKLYSQQPARYGYLPTEKGLSLVPALLTFYEWCREWFEEDIAAPAGVVHKPCGHSLHVQIDCEKCGLPLKAKDVKFKIILASPARGTGRKAKRQTSGSKPRKR